MTTSNAEINIYLLKTVNLLVISWV